MTLHVRQSHVTATVTKCGTSVVDAHQMQHGRVKVMNFDAVFNRLVSKFIGGSVNRSRLHPTTCHPNREAERIVVATVFSLRERRASELARPYHQGFVQHPTATKVR